MVDIKNQLRQDTNLNVFMPPFYVYSMGMGIILLLQLLYICVLIQAHTCDTGIYKI